jgi:hypothetical protein
VAAINPPTWLQAGSYSAQHDRLALAGMLLYPGIAADEGSPWRVRSGVKPSYQNLQMRVRAQATPTMNVIVSGGYAIIDARDTGGKGTYVCCNDGDVVLSIDAAGGAGQYRKDCVVASVYDAETSGTANEWRLEVIKGTNATSAGAAARPALPANSIPLADIAVGPSQTSVATANITDARPYTVASGGILPVTSSAAPTRLAPGQMLYHTNTDQFVYGMSSGSTAVLNPKPTAWTPISLTGAWTTYTGGNGSTPTPSARITADGTLELAGIMWGVAINAGANASIGSVPASMIPDYAIRGVAATSVAQNFARIAIDPTTGAITATNGGTALGSTGFLQLDGIRGRAR